MLAAPALQRTPSELAKAKHEAESISHALREAHRPRVMGSFAQRVTSSEKSELHRQKSVPKFGAVAGSSKARDPTMDFGSTVDIKASSSRAISGEQKRTMLMFDSKAEFKNDGGSLDEDDADTDSALSGINAVTSSQRSEEEDSFGYRDLVFYLFDGFPRADLAGMFPSWYEASLWAERVNFFFVITSIVGIATETLPQFYNENLIAFFVIEIICIAYFTADFVLRVCCTPNLSKFAKSVLNWVDLISILPFYVGQIMDAVTTDSGTVGMLRYFRLLRILRVLKLSRRNVGLLAVWEALRESSEAITLLGFLMMIALLLFSSLMFYAEQLGADFDTRLNLWIRADGKASPFQSIFHTMWWCIVTMSTVGYGDEVPVTVVGKLIGGATMICGVFVLAFPTVILSTNFQEIHQSKVDGHMQMQQIFAAQREAAQKRSEERRKKKEQEKRLQEEMSAEFGDGGEVERNDVQRTIIPVVATSGSATPTGKEAVLQPAAEAAAPALPQSFTFFFDPYDMDGNVAKTNRAVMTLQAAMFAEDDGTKDIVHREIVVVGDTVALYNPVLHLATKKGALRVKVDQCLSRSVVTLKLALESEACQRAAEQAVKQNRPDLSNKVVVLPRPITKLKVDVVCDHPLLHGIRLQCSTFTEPAGAVPLSLVVPYPSLVSVLLANLSSVTLMTWVFYENPSGVDEPLYHYGGAVLAGTDFDEEEVDIHARKLISSQSATSGPVSQPLTTSNTSTEAAPTRASTLHSSSSLGLQNDRTEMFAASSHSAGRTSPSLPFTSDSAWPPLPTAQSDLAGDQIPPRLRSNTRRLSLDVSTNAFNRGNIRSPSARSPVPGHSPIPDSHSPLPQH